MNILFTDLCNLSCPYCFAKGKLRGYKEIKEPYISFRNLNIIIDFLKRSRLKDMEVGVIGGEPTLHPEFKRFFIFIMKEGFRIRLLSNGIIKPDIVKFLKENNRQRWHMLININEPAEYKRQEWAAIKATLESLKSQVTLGFVISRTGSNMDFMIELVERYGLAGRIRVAFAVPIWGYKNRYLPLGEYKRASSDIVKFAAKCDKRDILLFYGCGFTFCSFNAKEYGRLHHYNALPRSICAPPVDVAPDLTIWRCFATSMIWNRKLTEFKDLRELEMFYIDKYRLFRKLGAKKNCLRCKYLKRRQCCGGCLGHTLNTFNFRELARLNQKDNP